MTAHPAAVLTDGILSMLLTHMRPLSMVEEHDLQNKIYFTFAFFM